MSMKGKLDRLERHLRPREPVRYVVLWPHEIGPGLRYQQNDQGRIVDTRTGEVFEKGIRLQWPENTTWEGENEGNDTP